ncbi:MAG: hypothetical protein C4K60_21220 [Ideonella sp. MAG2]|nr:MAG: hypothetical protein C4K60_21220 [Ideonella sp. MAG2]
MPIKWKEKFKPLHVIERIASVRTYSENGKASYSGFVIDECMPTLHSMLAFPSAAADIDQETLIWRALDRSGKELTTETFLRAANDELSARLATKEIQYSVLTSISISPQKKFQSITLLGCKIQLLEGEFSRKFTSYRRDVIEEFKTEVVDTPTNYCKVVATVSAKSPGAAFHKAMRAIDLLRSLMCLMYNPRMQIAYGARAHEAINVIRLGGHHTVHLMDGKSAREGYWYEPYFKPKSVFTPDAPSLMAKNIRWAAKRISESNFNKALISSLLMFVRGLDLHEQNAAFLKVWGALELLTTPNVADYEKLIRRSSFLFKEVEYQRQVLEHLRQYRNANVHAGEESENARIHCFQLQTFYSAVAWFCIRNGMNFASIDDLGAFLDLPSEPSALQERLKNIRKAIKFRSPG